MVNYKEIVIRFHQIIIMLFIQKRKQLIILLMLIKIEKELYIYLKLIMNIKIWILMKILPGEQQIGQIGIKISIDRIIH